MREPTVSGEPRLPPGMELESSGRIDAWFERASEQLNPILVKESRQALKSRQFVITFFLMLIAAWLWTIVGVNSMVPDIFFADRGIQMLIGYIWILAIPLLVIVPFSAFRSLTVEVEDGTYELIQVSTLTPQQIVFGKLGTAVLQGLLYLSAIAPCMAFTYMLRGVEAITILLVVGHLAFAMLVLNSLGISMASAAQHRVWQWLISVLLVIGLFLAAVSFTYALSAGLERIEQRYLLDARAFWIVHLAWGSFWGSFALLGLVTAAARLTFASENRSTRPRLVMCVQQYLLFVWVTFLYATTGDTVWLLLLAGVGMAYWLVMGSLLIGESDYLSDRVRRSLPRSTFTRALFQWLTPSGATGYQFATLNALSLLLYIAAMLTIEPPQPVPGGQPSTEMVLLLLAGGWAYTVCFLAISRLALRGVGRFSRPSAAAGFLVTAVIVLFASLIPVSIRVSTRSVLSEEYYLWEIVDPHATLTYWINQSVSNNFWNDITPSVLSLAALAGTLYVTASCLSLRAVLVQPYLEERSEVPGDPSVPKSTETTAAKAAEIHPLDAED